jgi:hypothetical protein
MTNGEVSCVGSSALNFGQPLRGERRQRVEVWQRLPVGVQRLDADMTSAGVEMRLDTLSDCTFASPGDHGVQEPVTPAACQIFVAKTDSFPVVPIIRQWQIKGHGLPCYLPSPAGVGD